METENHKKKKKKVRRNGSRRRPRFAADGNARAGDRVRDRDGGPHPVLLLLRAGLVGAPAGGGDGGAAAEAAGEEEGDVEGGDGGQRVARPQELQEVLHLPQGRPLRRGLQRRRPRRRPPEPARGRRRGDKRRRRRWMLLLVLGRPWPLNLSDWIGTNW